MYQMTEDVADLKKMIIMLTISVDTNEATGMDVSVGRDHIGDLGIILEETEARLEACKDPEKLCI